MGFATIYLCAAGKMVHLFPTTRDVFWNPGFDFRFICSFKLAQLLAWCTLYSTPFFNVDVTQHVRIPAPGRPDSSRKSSWGETLGETVVMA